MALVMTFDSINKASRAGDCTCSLRFHSKSVMTSKMKIKRNMNFWETIINCYAISTGFCTMYVHWMTRTEIYSYTMTREREFTSEYSCIIGSGPQCHWSQTPPVPVSQTLCRSVSECFSWVSDYSLTCALARRLLEASGLTLYASCVSHILGHARALVTRVRLSSLVSSPSRLSPPSLVYYWHYDYFWRLVALHLHSPVSRYDRMLFALFGICISFMSTLNTVHYRLEPLRQNTWDWWYSNRNSASDHFSSADWALQMAACESQLVCSVQWALDETLHRVSFRVFIVF